MKDTHESASTQSDIREELRYALVSAGVKPARGWLQQQDQLYEELRVRGIVAKRSTDPEWREVCVDLLRLLTDLEYYLSPSPIVRRILRADSRRITQQADGSTIITVSRRRAA
jgi:hypothetical protein